MGTVISAAGKSLALKLHLEGQDVPVISAVVSVNYNSPATASIQVVPLDEAMDLKPRTMVHLYFLDDTTSADLAEDLRYKLLFAGEYVGFASVTTPSSRSFILQCVDFSNHWDSVHASILQYGPAGTAFSNLGSVYGATAGVANDLQEIGRVILREVNKRPVTEGLTGVQGLAGGIIHLLEYISGAVANSPGTNDFFRLEELRCKTLAQVTAEEKDNTAQNLFGKDIFTEWLVNGLQNASSYVTFRTVLNMFLQRIFYDFVPNPAACIDAAIKGEKKEVFHTEAIISSTQGSNISKFLKSVREFVATFPKSVSATMPNRTKELGSIVASVTGDIQTFLKMKTGTYPKQLLDVVQETATKVVDNLTGGKDQAVHDTQLAALIGYLDTLQASFDGTKINVSDGIVDTGKGIRLHSQILRPDCWFVPPPVCNVIFPDMYTQLTYERGYLNECSRMVVQGINAIVQGDIHARDPLMSNWVMSPFMKGDKLEAASTISTNNASPNSAPNNAATTGTKESVYHILMPHEYHTGVVPRIEAVPDTVNVSSSLSDAQVASSSNEVLSWMDKAALYHFFKNRYAGRQAAVSCRFTPRLVCGFPAVVIRRPLDLTGLKIPDGSTPQEELRLVEKYLEGENANTKLQIRRKNYSVVGLVTGLTHSISQDGGSTSFSMTHARAHIGADDDLFAHMDKAVGDTVVRSVSYALKADKNASRANSADNKLLIDVTPQGEMTNPVPPNADTSFVQPGVSTITGKPVLVPAGMPAKTVKSTGGKYGGEIAFVEVKSRGNVDSIGGKRAFRQVTITENVTVSSSDPLPVPFEELVRPSWLSPAYANGNITSHIYKPFFNCDSMVSKLEVEGFDGGSITTTGDSVDYWTPLEVGGASPEEVRKRILREAKVRASATTSRAITDVSYSYSKIKAVGADIDTFINEYTSRPIATMRDIVGSDEYVVKVNAPKGSVVVNESKQRGFHTGAINRTILTSGVKLAGLQNDWRQDASSAIPVAANSTSTPVLLSNYDVRKEKWDRVTEYKIALEGGPGFRG